MSIKKILRNIRTLYRVVTYSGSKYECPYCGYKAKELLPIGLPHKANVDNRIIGAGQRKGGCVKCDSMDRDRLLFAYLNHEMNVFQDLKEYSILHLAPEWRLTELFQKYQYKEYVCTDKFMPGYKYPSHTIDMDIMNITFTEGTFDLVICNHVLEHISDDIAAMKELYRVLKNNGTAILQVPISAILKNTYENPDVITDEQRIEHYGQYDHVRIYGQDYVSRLQLVGFKVNRVNISKKYQKYGVIKEEDLFICTK